MKNILYYFSLFCMIMAVIMFIAKGYDEATFWVGLAIYNRMGAKEN